LPREGRLADLARAEERHYRVAGQQTPHGLRVSPTVNHATNDTMKSGCQTSNYPYVADRAEVGNGEAVPWSLSQHPDRHELPTVVARLVFSAHPSTPGDSSGLSAGVVPVGGHQR
jgi:hypothetical protein